AACATGSSSTSASTSTSSSRAAFASATRSNQADYALPLDLSCVGSRARPTRAARAEEDQASVQSGKIAGAADDGRVDLGRAVRLPVSLLDEVERAGAHAGDGAAERLGGGRGDDAAVGVDDERRRRDGCPGECARPAREHRPGKLDVD